MSKLPTLEELFKAGAHFGHRKSRSDARAHDFVFAHRNKIAIIDLEKTRVLLEEALDFLKTAAKDGALFLFVGTKPQAREEVKKVAEELGQPYIVERWPGGLITNFDVVFKAVKKMLQREQDLAEGKFATFTKKERLKIEKDLQKAKRILGGLAKMERKTDILAVIDAKEEEIALLEAKRAGLKVVALCDTNSNPRLVDYPIPVNDDATATVKLICNLIKETIKSNYKVPVKAAEVEERLQDKTESEPVQPKAKSKRGDGKN